MNPYFSIIIPTYNRAHLICKTLNSFLNQTNENFEVIIVDDGSIDDTSEVVQEFIKQNDLDNIHYYFKENEERAAARNFGAKLAKGVYVNFFDSDDIALPNHLEEAVSAIKLYNNPEVFHLNYAWVNYDLKITQEIQVYEKLANNELLNGNTLSCNGVFIRRDVALEFPFNESRDLSISEDWDLWLRLSPRFTIYKIPTVTSHIVDHEDRSVSQFNEERINKRKMALLKSLEGDVVFTSKYPRAIKKIEAHMNSYLALHAVLAGHKIKAVNYFVLALLQYKGEIFKRRTLAIFKHLLFS
jgi:glycosyltransferase involved in cell wall biosynthesis